MHTVIASFDDIYYLQRYRAGRTQPKRTVFTFGDRSQYIPAANITVPGHPRIEAGMRVKALLRKQDDWTSLVGWKDVDTGEVAAPDPRGPLWGAAFLAFWCLACLVLFLKSAGSFAIVMALVAGAFMQIDIGSWRRAKADEAAVHALAMDSSHDHLNTAAPQS